LIGTSAPAEGVAVSNINREFLDAVDARTAGVLFAAAFLAGVLFAAAFLAGVLFVGILVSFSAYNHDIQLIKSFGQWYINFAQLQRFGKLLKLQIE
jgi:hypothetical protein